MAKKLNLSRRSFLKAAVATATAATVGSSFATTSALAETEEPQVEDDIRRIRTTCRGCGKMECGVWVTVKNGRAIAIEGDESSKTSNGNCCTKSQASLQAAYHPDRLQYPMKRTTPKGDQDCGWQRISWDEAYELVAQGLTQVQEKYGSNSIMHQGGTSRMYGMANYLIGAAFGAKNCVAAAQICKGPRREAGALTIENGFHFMSVEDMPKVYVMWGTDQTQSNYDTSCRTVVEAAQRAEKFIVVDPRLSNSAKEADYHLAIRPATDGAMFLGWTHIVMRDELYDDLLVKRWTNAPFLYCEDIDRTGWIGVSNNTSKAFDMKTRLLKESDLVEGGDPKKFMVWDNINDKLTYFDANEEGDHAGMWEGQTEYDYPTTGYEYERGGWVPDPMPFPVDIDPALWGEFEVTLKDGRTVKVKPVWQKYWDDSVEEMTPEKVGEICGVDPQLIEDSCKAWAVRIDPAQGNGGINVNLAPEQGGRAIQNFRAGFILAVITGNYDIPAGNRGVTTQLTKAGILEVPTGGRTTPRDPDAEPVSNWDARADICGAEKFPMTRWWTQWCDATSVWDACHTGEPYPIKACIVSASDFMNQSNSIYAWEALQQMDFLMQIDLWDVPGAGMADVLMPAQHWLEIPGFPRASQGASGGIGAMQHCIEAPGEAQFEGETVCGIYRAAGIPFFNDDGKGDVYTWDAERYLDWTVSAMGVTWKELTERFQNEGWIEAKKEYPERWGTYRRYSMGYLRGADSAFGFKDAGASELSNIPGTNMPTMKMEIWSTILESCIDSEELPTYEEPPLSPVTMPDVYEEYPFNMTSGRRIPVYFHSEHRQLPWCREQWPVPRMEINPEDAAELGLEQGDWVWIETPWGKVRETVDLFYGIKRGVINAEHQWWYPEFHQADRGFKLSCLNIVNNQYAQDPISGATQMRGLPAKVYKATPENSPFNNPVPCDDNGVEIISSSSDPRLKEWERTYEGRE